jgi:hypothetical protein
VKRYSYYTVDTGFFPLATKLCFNKRSFEDVLRDYNILPKDDPNPFEMGVAETHSFSNLKESVVIVGVNLDAIGDSAASLAGVIAHECSHVIERLLEHVGEQVEDFGEETRAYLMQSLVEQIFTACALELKKNAKRKAARTKIGAKGQGDGGPVPEVDKPGNDGGAGPAGVLPGSGDPGGAEVLVGGVISTSDLSDLTTTYVWRPDVGAFVVRGS